MFTLKAITNNAMYAAFVATALVLFAFTAFFAAEPSVIYGQAATSTPFTITQTITGENSFLVQPTDVTMSGSIAGLTGGNATGSTQFVVQSNNSSGYYVNIQFTDNAGAYAMYGDTTGSDSIRDYDESTPGTADFGFTASTASQFAYSVISSTTADTAQGFDHAASNCNSGGADNADLTCWKAPTTADYEIVRRGSAAPTGATSTIVFKVDVPSGAVPTPVTDTYTATATLTLYLQ